MVRAWPLIATATVGMVLEMLATDGGIFKTGADCWINGGALLAMGECREGKDSVPDLGRKEGVSESCSKEVRVEPPPTDTLTSAPSKDVGRGGNSETERARPVRLLPVGDKETMPSTKKDGKSVTRRDRSSKPKRSRGRTKIRG